MAKEKSEKGTAMTDPSVGVNVAGEMLPTTDVFGPTTPMDGIEIRLSQIKIAHQNVAYELPDGTFTKEFKGHILDIVNVNAWWEKSFEEGGSGNPPQCFSMDGVVPSARSEKIQNNLCASCAMNKFGSDGGRGKACKNMKRVHIMFEGERFPKRLTVPPSSLEAVNVYGSSLIDKGLPYNGVFTIFGLRKAENKDHISYSQLVLRMDGRAANTRDEYAAILKKREMFMPAMRGQDIEAEEYTSAD